MLNSNDCLIMICSNLQVSGGNPCCHSSPPNPPIVTATTIPESELECDEMFEAIVPADDNDDRMVTTKSSLNTQPEEEEPQELLSGLGSVHCMQLSNGHHHPHPVQQLTGPLHNMAVPFFPFSLEDSPTPLGGPNLQNTAEISSPEQVPLPSSTVSALPIPDTISPELSLQLPAHCFQQIPGFQLWFSSAGSPHDSTSGGLVSPLTAPLSPPYLPAAVNGDQASHCYQEL